MHVKLEVETQPLSNLWVKLRRAFKICLSLAVFIAVNAAGVIFAFTWIPNHVRNPNDAIVYSWMLAVCWTGLIWLPIAQARLNRSEPV